jgi:hypothetical protein
MNENLDKLLTACEDLGYLNKFAPYLRETEYRILLLVCGHTRHGKVSLNEVEKLLSEYWEIYDSKNHVKNIKFLITQALKNIQRGNLYVVSRETFPVNT